MDIERPAKLGASLDRTISDRDISSAPGEWVEKELDATIARFDKKRREEEGERPAEAPWVASERRQEARRRKELHAEWAAFHQHQERRVRANSEVLILHHRERAAYHEEQIEKYLPKGAAKL